jgi:S1-C subfamily serine protease
VDGTAGFFPIIHKREGAPWIPIATGFFISQNGLFATAKHVVVDRDGQIIRSLAGVQLLRGDNRVIVRDVKKIVVHPRADVAVGFLFDREFAENRTQTVNKCFELTRSVPEVGSKVVTFAFPQSELRTAGEAFHLKFSTAVSKGVLEVFYPEGRDSVVLPGRCFQTSMNILAGASGGPVAFGDGRVFGINSTGMEGVPVGFVSSVNDLLDLEVRAIRLPDGVIRERITLSELAERDLIRVR